MIPIKGLAVQSENASFSIEENSFEKFEFEWEVTLINQYFRHRRIGTE